jgi:hypothetical protein
VTPNLRALMAAAAIALAASATSPASASDAPGLAEAQQAYAAVDFASTRDIAAAALERGGNDRADTAELYRLLATAAAALNQPDESRAFFVYALVTNPTLKLDRALSPKIRAPYLEARGSVALEEGKPPLNLTLRRRGSELEVELYDPLQITAAVELGMRSAESSGFAKRRFRAERSKRVPMPSGAELQFYLLAHDRHGNVLFELGSTEEPRRLALASSTKPAAPPPPSDDRRSPTAYYVTAGALAALGLAAGGVATAMHLRREDAASKWNGPGCEQPGRTREQQCASIDRRRRDAESLTIGFAAGGSALLLGSLVSVLIAPAGSRHGVALSAGPDQTALRYRVEL